MSRRCARCWDADAIATVSGRGYRFSLDVTRDAAGAGRAGPAAKAQPAAAADELHRPRAGDPADQAMAGHHAAADAAGAGGCGKTRLALQVAGTMLDEYPEGVWLVELAPLGDSTLIAQAVAKALGVTRAVGQGPRGDGGRMAGAAAVAAVAGQRRAPARGAARGSPTFCCGAVPGSRSSSRAGSAWASTASSRTGCHRCRCRRRDRTRPARRYWPARRRACSSIAPGCSGRTSR